MKKRITSILLIIVFCLGVLLIYVYIKKNKQENVLVSINIEKDIWKTYKDNEFTFKYPSDFKIVDKNDGGIYLIRGDGDLLQDQIIYISKYGKTDQLSMQDWWRFEGPQTHRQAPRPDVEDKMLVSGYESVLSIYESERILMGLTTFAKINLYVFVDSNIFEITTYKIAEDILNEFKDKEYIYDEESVITPEIINKDKENEKIFLQVLESLEFTPL